MDGNTMTTAPKVVNGINVDDLFALIEGVRSDPAKAKTRWRVATAWQGQTCSRSTVEGFGIGGKEVARHFAIDIDEPPELGGANRFANPQEHLIAALNACMTVGYVAQCAVRGITLESLAIERVCLDRLQVECVGDGGSRIQDGGVSQRLEFAADQFYGQPVDLHARG